MPKINASDVQWDAPLKINPADVQWNKSTTQAAEGMPTQRNYAVSELPSEAASNFPKSAQKFATGIYEAVSSPVQTVKGLIDIGAGALQNVLPQGVVDFVNSFSSDPANADRAVTAANAVGGMYKDRYGDYEKIKRTFAVDPVGLPQICLRFFQAVLE